MGKITITNTEIEDVLIVTPALFRDPRGFFLESYSRRDFEMAGIRGEFVQDNHSRSTKGVLRGLHYQFPHAQDKLIRVTFGSIYDVAVDIRTGSPTYGKWVGVMLSENSPEMLYIPAGFAHGFVVISDIAEVQYKVNEYYDPSAEGGIRWDDPDIGILWPLHENGIEFPLLSEKDRHYLEFLKFVSPFQYVKRSEKA